MSGTRTLTFPADASLGQLIVQQEGAERQTLDARGSVEIPADAMAHLEMAEDADVAGLSALPADALVGVSFRNLKPDTIAPIARQTGLKSLILAGSFSDADVAQLENASEVEMLMLMSDQLTGGTLARLSLPAGAYVLIISSALTTQGVTAALSLGVETLHLQGSTLSSADLDAVPTIAAAGVGITAEPAVAAALVRLVERSPALTSLGARAANDGPPPLDDATALALRQARPELSINGVWYDEGAVARMASGTTVELGLQQAAPADPVELTVDNFEELIGGDTPVLVDFTAVWCGPCKRLKPTIHELTGELADRLVVGTLDIDEQRPIAERYGVNAVPTLLVFQRGAQVARIGSQKKDEILTQLAPVL